MSNSKGKMNIEFLAEPVLLVDLVRFLFGLFFLASGIAYFYLDLPNPALIGLVLFVLGVFVLWGAMRDRLNQLDAKIIVKVDKLVIQFSKSEILEVELRDIKDVFVGVDGEVIVKLLSDNNIVWPYFTSNETSSKFVDLVSSKLQQLEASH